MTGGVVLGGVAALLAFWILMSALEGLGYAVPSRPSVIVPQRWSDGAQVLLAVMIGGLVASFLIPLVLGHPAPATPFHVAILVGAALPLWEMIAARMYGDSFVIVNGRQEDVRPIAIRTLNSVFGELYEEDDMLLSVEPKNKDWQLIPHPREHLLVLDPHYRVAVRERRALEQELETALKRVKPTGFNDRSFWISFILPLWFVAAYAGIAYALLRPLVAAPAG